MVLRYELDVYCYLLKYSLIFNFKYIVFFRENNIYILVRGISFNNLLSFLFVSYRN